MVASCGGSALGGGPGDSGADALAEAAATADATRTAADATLDAQVNADAASCLVLASHYDQGCVADTDCDPVYSGDYCGAGCVCPNAAISAQAQSQFSADVRAALASRPSMPSGTGCVCLPHACCQNGQCVLGNSCGAASDANAAMPDAFADSTPGIQYTVLCVADAGPEDSGVAVSGESRWCNGSEVCTPFNGGWECCVMNQGAGAFCISP